MALYMRNARLAASVFAAFLFGFVSFASAEAGADVSTFQLDNGLQVVVIPDHRAPVVTHMVWYKVGAADEARGKSGIAHFFEHLMFKGTKEHPGDALSQAVSEIGGNNNAFTTSDYTAFFEEVTPAALGTMMALEADRMHNLILTDDVIGPERDVIIEERLSRVESDPGSLLSEEAEATLYQNHPYGVPVIGWMHEIRELNRQDAIDFYQHYYAPNNAILVVAGDTDAATVRQLAEETYGKVPRGPALPPRIRPTEPEQNASRTVTMKDPRVSLPSMQKSWVVPSYGSAKPGEAEALDLLAEILGGGVRSRLYQKLVVKDGIAASAGAFYQGTTLDDTEFGVYGAPRGGATIGQIENAIDGEIARISAEGVSQEELDAAKARFVRGAIFARDNQSGMARLYGSTLAAGGTVEDVKAWPDRIDAVTADEVKAMAAKYLVQTRSVASFLLPATEKTQ